MSPKHIPAHPDSHSDTIAYESAKVHEPMQRRAEVGDTKDKPATLRRLATIDNERSGQ